jgi:hypothetical protein
MCCFQCPKAFPLSEVHDMGRAQEIDDALAAWCVDAFQVSVVGECGGFVEQDPISDAVSQLSCYDRYIIGEPAGHVAVRPASAIFEGLRQIPVIESWQGANPSGEQLIDYTLVEIQAFGFRHHVKLIGHGEANVSPGVGK